MTTGPSLLTDEDVADLNRGALARTAAVVRVVSVVLIIVAGLGLLAWLWVLARSQQIVGGERRSALTAFGSGSGESLSLTSRVDLVVSSITFLLSSTLLAGAGLGLRLFADFAVIRAGGSVTGFQAGDDVPAAEGTDSDDERPHPEPPDPEPPDEVWRP